MEHSSLSVVIQLSQRCKTQTMRYFSAAIQGTARRFIDREDYSQQCFPVLAKVAAYVT